VQLWACGRANSADPLHGGRGNQLWTINAVPGGYQLVNPASRLCLTAVKAAGWAVGLDAGLTVTAAQAHPCLAAGTANQTFLLTGDGQGDSLRDGTVTVSSVSTGKCLQPQLEKLPHFDAVAFEHPDDGEVALVVMNTNDATVQMSIRDETAAIQMVHSVPGHAIHSYRWRPRAQSAAVETREFVDSVATSAATFAAITATPVLPMEPQGLVGGSISGRVGGSVSGSVDGSVVGGIAIGGHSDGDGGGGWGGDDDGGRSSSSAKSSFEGAHTVASPLWTILGGLAFLLVLVLLVTARQPLHGYAPATAMAMVNGGAANGRVAEEEYEAYHAFTEDRR